jgi:hypothetical protein
LRDLRSWAKIALFIAGSVAAQFALLFAAASTQTGWLAWPAAPGLYSMRLLPNDPQTAGSFIVFPTLAQSLLALAVNTGVYAGVFASYKWLKRTYHKGI